MRNKYELLIGSVHLAFLSALLEGQLYSILARVLLKELTSREYRLCTIREGSWQTIPSFCIDLYVWVS